jgi:ATP-dependent Lon protease
LAALRGGIKKVLIPQANVKDLEDMPKEVLDNLKIIPISKIDEALKECLIVKNDDNGITTTIKKSTKK